MTPFVSASGSKPGAAAILKVAVVGHTNTGKTSLMRTLTRDVSFGDVSDRPATTRHVEGATLMVHGRPHIALYDTPGLEDSIGLLEHLDSLSPPAGAESRRIDRVELIERFLAGPDAHGRFAQEAKALRQVLASDLALYVIDARDRVLGKHRDELEILGRCARPVVPVLNFIATPEAQVQVWRDHLARVNMHAVAEFDTVMLDDDSEQRLMEKMRSLLGRHHETIDALIDERRQQRARLVRASADLVADMLIDAAAFVLVAPVEDRKAADAAVESLKERVRAREQECVQALLELHRFRPADYAEQGFPLAEGKWGVDLFNPAAMKQFGVRTGGGAAAGALAGLTIDAMVGGMTLGAAAAVGATIGAIFGAGHTHGKRLIDIARGRAELRCDDATLRLLLARQASLIVALLHRGHASLDPIRLEGASRGAGLPKELAEARIRSQWSRLSADAGPVSLASASRRSVQDRIADGIMKTIARR